MILQLNRKKIIQWNYNSTMASGISNNTRWELYMKRRVKTDNNKVLFYYWFKFTFIYKNRPIIHNQTIFTSDNDVELVANYLINAISNPNRKKIKL